MELIATSVQDAFLLQLDPQEDSRGSFCRLFCTQFLKTKGIVDHTLEQINISRNTHKGTLRGLHYQTEPHATAKIVHCLQGEVYDVIVDLRPHSPTYLNHFGYHLNACKPYALYIPKGCAHGFLTLQEQSQLLYLMSHHYDPASERGYRFDDPAFEIPWPSSPDRLSERDLTHPAYVL